MSKSRVLELSEIAVQNNLTIIEDDSYISGAISDEHPTFVHSLPEQTYYISGFSKTIQPGLRVGYVLVPEKDISLAKSISLSLNYSVSPLLLQIVKDWIGDGTAAAIRNENRDYFNERQVLVSQALAGAPFRADSNNAQVWLWLPEGWTSRRFAEAALAENIRISPAESFQVRQGTSTCEAVRLCVAGIVNDELFAKSLATISSIYNAPPKSADYAP